MEEAAAAMSDEAAAVVAAANAAATGVMVGMNRADLIHCGSRQKL